MPFAIIHESALYIKVERSVIIRTVEEIFGYKSDPEVLKFIEDFMCHSAQNAREQEVLRHTFRAGYCYYFAKMLEVAFERGKVCWAAPYSHIVWLDDNGCPYDIEGVCACEAVYYIPVEYLGVHLQDFMHIKQDGEFANKNDLERIIREYEAENNLVPISF